VLGEENGSLVSRYFGIGSGGSFEGSAVLHVPTDSARFAAEVGLDPAGIESVIARSRLKLLQARERRPSPPRDDKILASWNGLMLQALAEASGVFGREDYRRAAVANASFLVSEMMKADVLMHSYKDGMSGIPGYLDDHASMVRGLLCLHEATFEQHWLQVAFDLADAMVRRFGDENRPGVLYDTGPDHGTLFAHPRDTSDSVKPCGGSAAADALLRISRITGDSSYEKLAGTMLGLVGDQMVAHPLASGNWLCSLDLHLSEPEEMVVVGSRDDPDTGALLTAIHGQYWPNKVIVGLQPGDPVFPLTEKLAKDRNTIGGRPTVYLCRRHTCHSPATDPDQLRRLLQN